MKNYKIVIELGYILESENDSYMSQNQYEVREMHIMSKDFLSYAYIWNEVLRKFKGINYDSIEIFIELKKTNQLIK
jgi:hypothetical protein